MKNYYGATYDNGACITFGRFDGVHAGHRAVIDRLCGEARARGLAPVLLLADNIPENGEACKRLTPEDEAIRLISRQNPDITIIKTPTDDVYTRSANFFVKNILADKYNAKKVVAGENCRFGAGRGGNADTLVSLSGLYGYEAAIVNTVFEKDGAILYGAPSSGGAVDGRCDIANDGAVVYSTHPSGDSVDGGCEITDGITASGCEYSEDPRRGNIINAGLIRGVLAVGDAAGAGRLLTRPYLLRGVVVPGRALGRRTNMPTANINVPPDKFIPAHGVYAVTVKAGGGSYTGLMHIGRRPTVDTSEIVTVEVHILGFSGDLYTQVIEAELHLYIRGTKKFNSLEEVKAQVDLDIIVANEFFRSTGK